MPANINSIVILYGALLFGPGARRAGREGKKMGISGNGLFALDFWIVHKVQLVSVGSGKN